MDTTLTIRCVAGPDAGWVARLRPGTHWLGRIHGDLQVIDPSVEAHHALIEVGDDGAARLLQVAGRAPIRVDGASSPGWVALGRGSVIEVGASRLELVDPSERPVGSAARVFAPLDDSDDELRRFERDVQRAAAAARHDRRSDHEPGTVTLGVADQHLGISVLDAASRPVDLATLPHPAAAVLHRYARAELPVVTSVTADRPMAIVGPRAEAVARRVARQLSARRRARLLTVSAADADALRTAGRPMIVLAPGVDAVPLWCVGVLDVGATWHGTWQPDVVDHPDRIVRLHVAGAAATARHTPVHVGLSSLLGTQRDMDGEGVGSGVGRADVGGAFVAEEVAGSAPELGGDVARIPQPAR